MTTGHVLHMACSLCGGCQQHVIAHGWRPGTRWAHESTCPGCVSTLDRLLARYGDRLVLSECPVTSGQLTVQQWRRQIAVHEAGHAVAGMRFGMRPVSVEVSLDPTSGGAPGVVRWGDESTSSEGRALMLLAGGAAASRWLRGCGLDTPVRLVDAAFESRSDVARASKHLGGAGLDAARLTAALLVDERRTEIAAVADRLVRSESGKLSLAEVRAAISGSGGTSGMGDPVSGALRRSERLLVSGR